MRFGPDTELLVKLLDAGERLPVHFHPDRDFARRHFGSARGKTEAWLIVETRREPATVWLGFRDDVESEKLVGWVDRQDGATMLGALNERGETLLMPYAAGPAELSGSVDVIRCLPPDPDGGTA